MMKHFCTASETHCMVRGVTNPVKLVRLRVRAKGKRHKVIREWHPDVLAAECTGKYFGRATSVAILGRMLQEPEET